MVPRKVGGIWEMGKHLECTDLHENCIEKKMRDGYMNIKFGGI